MVVRVKLMWRETSGPVTIKSPLYTREDVKANDLPFMDFWVASMLLVASVQE